MNGNRGRDEHEWLAEHFEHERPRLRAVAYRLLGSLSEADDAVQESWLHVSRSDSGSVTQLGRWLTTVVARVCLDMLRARAARREDLLEGHLPDPILSRAEGMDPEQEVLLGEAVGLALQVVLETLEPAERVAFVLHDVFAVPFDEIAPLVERSPLAARQLASRARRRVQGAAPVPDADLAHSRTVVDAFLAAVREGDFAALLAVLDPDVVVRADYGALHGGAPREVRGHALWPRGRSCLRALPRLPSRCWSMERWGWSPRREDSHMRSWASPSGRARLLKSTSWVIPIACASLIFRCSTSDACLVGAWNETYSI